MSGLITTLLYILWHKSHKIDTGEYFLRDHFHSELSSTITLSVTTFLLLCLGNVQC